MLHKFSCFIMLRLMKGSKLREKYQASHPCTMRPISWQVHQKESSTLRQKQKCLDFYQNIIWQILISILRKVNLNCNRLRQTQQPIQWNVHLERCGPAGAKIAQVTASSISGLKGYAAWEFWTGRVILLYMQYTYMYVPLCTCSSFNIHVRTWKGRQFSI